RPAPPLFPPGGREKPQCFVPRRRYKTLGPRPFAFQNPAPVGVPPLLKGALLQRDGLARFASRLGMKAAFSTSHEACRFSALSCAALGATGTADVSARLRPNSRGRTSRLAAAPTAQTRPGQ